MNARHLLLTWALTAALATLAIAACASNQGTEHIKASALDIKPELTQAEAFTLKVFFHNTSQQPCSVIAYEMRWEGGEKRVEPKPPFTVAPGKKEWQVVTVEGIKDEEAFKRSLRVAAFCKEG